MKRHCSRNKYAGCNIIGRKRGFSLLELMIVVALVALLATLAYPSYQSYVLRSKRAIAKIRLMDIVEQETRYFIANRTYGDLSDLGFSADTIGINSDGEVTAGSGTHDLSVAIATASAFTVQAVAQTQQANDTGCTTLTVNQAGVRTPQTCW